MTHAMNQDLDQLAGQAARGDTEAFRRLAGLIAPLIHQLAWRILVDSQLATDAVQEFLIKLAGILPGYDSKRPFWPWAQRIATRLTIDLARKERTWKSISLDLVPDYAGPEQDRPDRRFEANQTKQRVHRALECLTGRQRTIFVLRDLEEWTTAEIAADLDMAESTVRVHLARARSRLRETLTRSEKGDSTC